MSSWGASANARPRIRLGYHQVRPAGPFVDKPLPATMVSAYYEMPSKYPKEQYRTWIRLLLESVPCHLVFFCEEELVPFIEDCRKAYPELTTIVPLSRDQWTANTRFSEAFWQAQKGLDPEANIHKSTDLYKVWYEKKEFVRRAIELNPYGHTDFVWTDAGCCRMEGVARLIKHFPVASRIPTDKIMLLNIGEFTERDEIRQTIQGVQLQGGPMTKQRIGGTLIAGSKEAWARYSEQYDTVLQKYLDAGLFIGKDQTIMATLVLEHRDTVSLVEPKPIFSEQWFYLLLYLGCSEKLFKILNDKEKVRQRRSFQELEALSV